MNAALQTRPTGNDLFAAAPSPKPLREHQLRAIGMLRQSLRAGNRRVVVSMATGSGKTRTAAEIITGALEKGSRVAFTVPAISLIDQTVEAFESEGIDAIGVLQANHARTDRRQPVQVVSVQTLARRARPDADVVVVDECHLSHRPMLEWMRDEPRKVFVGLSATPWAKGMADDWQDLIVPVEMQDLIDRGFLSPFRVFAPTHPDMSGVKIRNGEYDSGGAAEVMGGLVADVVTTWIERARGLPTLVFAVDRAHAALLVKQFAQAGIGMGYCDAHTDVIERKLLFARMARGELAGIVNIGTLTTGVDADVRCVVLARPTRSEMLFVQMIGRGLRTAPGKSECVLLDHADNHARLGFVIDIRHDALRTGKDKTPATASERGEPMPKACGSCGTLKPAKVHACPSCGFEPVRQSTIEVEDGELIEIGRGAASPAAAKAAPTLADRQRFWAMARHVDAARGKGGKLAKALFKTKFGSWPDGLGADVLEPDSAFLSYERSRRIAYAKAMASKGAAR